MAVSYVSGSGASSGGATTLTITAPASIADGDILFATIYANVASTTITPPTGWTEIRTMSGGGGGGFSARQSTFWKRAASESGDYVFTFSSSQRSSGGISVFRGALASGDPVDVESGADGINPPVAPSVTTTVDGAMLVYSASFDATNTGSWTPPSGMTESVDTAGASASTIDYELLGAAGATGTREGDCTYDGAFFAAFLVAFKPAVVTAVKLYLRSTQTNGIGSTYYDLLTTAGSSADTAVVDTTVAGTEIQFTKTAGGTVAQFISGRVPSGGFTLTSSDVSLWMEESSALVNAGGRYRLFKRESNGTETELAAGPFDDGVEFGTSATEMTWAGDPTDTAFAEDDRVLLKIYVTNVGVMAIGTATLTFNAADAATGDSFINIFPSVTFKSEGTTASGALDVDGVATANFTGASRASGALNSAGAATATFVGAHNAPGALSVAGASTVNFEGASSASGALTSSGVATAEFVGADAGSYVSGALAVAGTSTVNFVGQSTASGNLSSDGSSTVNFVGASTSSGALSSDGAATVNFEGNAAGGVQAGDLYVVGSSTVNFVGDSTGGGPVVVDNSSMPGGGAVGYHNAGDRRRRRIKLQDERDMADFEFMRKAA